MNSKFYIFVAGLLVCFSFAGNLVAQNKVVIGIGEIESNVREANPENFQTMVETVLVNTNKFNVIERSRLDEILAERGLGMSGLTDNSDGLTGISGVDYMVYGSITKLGESKKQQNLFVAGLNRQSSVYEFAADLRIVDVANGRVVLAENVDISSDSEQSFTVGGLRGLGALGQSSDEGDPLSDVQRMGAVRIGEVISTTISPIRVAAVQSDGTVILNYGTPVLSEGRLLKVFEVGEGFTDPETGEVLGAEEIEVGVLRVNEALDKFSKAKIESGNIPNVSDLVRFIKSDDIKEVEKEIKRAGR